ncbi:hypothetical protein JXA56_05345 [Candidatus Micrarchaeota archaeon]|nr:hypothetical protein [Candidatus Micrarchaeota archaeon]
MKALIFAEGNGFGHVSRDSLIAKQYGFPIMTFGDGAKFCKERNIRLIEIPAPYALRPVENKVKIVANYRELAKMADQKVQKEILRHFHDYDRIIVDGSPLGIALSMLAGKKCVYITNDTSSLVGVNGYFSRTVARSLYSQILSYPEKIIIPDFPPPLTITKLNLNNEIPMVFSGPLVSIPKQRKHGKKVLVAGRLENLIKPVLGDSALYGNELEDLRPYLKSTEVVICHGGHTTIMEALACGKPVIVIEDENHHERYQNGLVLEKNNLGILLDRRMFSPAALQAAIALAKTSDRKKLAIYKKFASYHLSLK